MNNNLNNSTQETALIYCRVSTAKQTNEGTGLESQEHRCLMHAKMRGYAVEKVFLESVSGGVELNQRKIMQELLSHLRKNKQSSKKYVVIFDDHKRLARATETHILLKKELEKLGARASIFKLHH